MKTWIEHQWGKIQHTCHVSSLQRAEIEPGEEDLALSLGFISADDDKDYWYNCRSTRVQLKKNARKYKGKLTGIVFNDTWLSKPLSNGLRIMETKRIYKEWIGRKGFAAYEGDDEFLPEDTCIMYYLEDELVAYSKLRLHNKSAQLLVNAGTIPKIAMDTLKYELYWLKEQGKEYCYFGQGYEHCSFWKADQSTFQWWDGNKWSRNIEEFKSLCDRDTKIVFESS